MRCGLSAKKTQVIHAKIEWRLIINVLQEWPWRRPANVFCQLRRVANGCVGDQNGVSQIESLSIRSAGNLRLFHYVSFKIVEMMCRERIFVIDLSELRFGKNYLTSIK